MVGEAGAIEKRTKTPTTSSRHVHTQI
jgi:hypothetical protein